MQLAYFAWDCQVVFNFNVFQAKFAKICHTANALHFTQAKCSTLFRLRRLTRRKFSPCNLCPWQFVWQLPIARRCSDIHQQLSCRVSGIVWPWCATVAPLLGPGACTLSCSRAVADSLPILWPAVTATVVPTLTPSFLAVFRGS